MGIAHLHNFNHPVTLVSSRRTLINKIIIRVLILLFVLSALAVSTAAYNNNLAAPSAKNTSNTSSFNLQPISPLISDESQSTVNQSTNKTSAGGTSVNTSNNSDTHTNVVVNGQEVPVPQNGTTQQTFTSPDSTTVVNVTNDTSGSNSNSTSLHTSINSNTTSHSTNRTNITEHYYESP